MKRALVFLVLVFLVFSIGFSLNCTYVEDFVENLVYAANSGKIDFDNAVNYLDESSSAYHNCTNKGILVIKGDGVYSYKINGSAVGTFHRKIFLYNSSTYSIYAYATGYLPETKNVTLGNFSVVIFELDKNTTTVVNQTSGGALGGGGPAPNTFYSIDDDSIISYLKVVSNDLNLSEKDIEYQEKVYKKVNFKVRYIRMKYGDANSLYYYFKNEWNETVRVKLIVVIPKEIAANLSGVSLVVGYKVIKGDPIVEWEKEVAPGQEVKVGYSLIKDINKVNPLIVLFSGIEVEETTAASTNETILPPPNVSSEEEQVQQNSSNETSIPKGTPNTGSNVLLYVIIAVVLAVPVIGGILFLVYRKRQYEEIEEALDKLDMILKTRRRR